MTKGECIMHGDKARSPEVWSASPLGYRAFLIWIVGIRVFCRFPAVRRQLTMSTKAIIWWLALFVIVALLLNGVCDLILKNVGK